MFNSKQTQIWDTSGKRGKLLIISPRLFIFNIIYPVLLLQHSVCHPDWNVVHGLLKIYCCFIPEECLHEMYYRILKSMKQQQRIALFINMLLCDFKVWH